MCRSGKGDAASDRAGSGRPSRSPAQRQAGLLSEPFDAAARIIRAGPDPADRTPLILGAGDDFALRRGHVYCIVLVNIETRRPADMFPERFAESFRASLAAYPGLEVTCRDRRGC